MCIAKLTACRWLLRISRCLRRTCSIKHGESNDANPSFWFSTINTMLSVQSLFVKCTEEKKVWRLFHMGYIHMKRHTSYDHQQTVLLHNYMYIPQSETSCIRTTTYFQHPGLTRGTHAFCQSLRGQSTLQWHDSGACSSHLGSQDKMQTSWPEVKTNIYNHLILVLALLIISLCPWK